MDQHARDKEQEAAVRIAPPRFVGRETELHRVRNALARPPLIARM